MTLAQLRAQAQMRFGEVPWEEESRSLSVPLIHNAINDAHRWFAARTLCYYDNDRSEAVTSSSARYALDSDVIKIDPAAVRILNTATYTAPIPRTLASLTVEYGALEAATGVATPTYYVTEMGGEANDVPVAIRLVPISTGNLTLLYGCWYYPAEMTAETDRPQLPEAEHHRLLAPICWKLAEALNGAGVAADVAMWAAHAEREAGEFSGLLHGGGARAPRTRGREPRAVPAAVTGGRR